MKLSLLIIASFISLTAFQANQWSKFYKDQKAIQKIQSYTGEKYQSGDCETKDIYESADESVVNACDVLEGV